MNGQSNSLEDGMEENALKLKCKSECERKKEKAERKTSLRRGQDVLL